MKAQRQPNLKEVESDTCGCVGLGHSIHFCSVHAAALELLDACKTAHALLCNMTSQDFNLGRDIQVRELLGSTITKAEKGE